MEAVRVSERRRFPKTLKHLEAPLVFFSLVVYWK